jgi:hypothetical protein
VSASKPACSGECASAEEEQEVRKDDTHSKYSERRNTDPANPHIEILDPIASDRKDAEGNDEPMPRSVPRFALCMLDPQAAMLAAIKLRAKPVDS